MGEGEDIEGDKTIHNTLQSEYLNSSKLNLLRHVSLSIIHSHNHISSLLSTLKHLFIYPFIHLSEYLSSIQISLIYLSIDRQGWLSGFLIYYMFWKFENSILEALFLHSSISRGLHNFTYSKLWDKNILLDF